MGCHSQHQPRLHVRLTILSSLNGFEQDPPIFLDPSADHSRMTREACIFGCSEDETYAVRLGSANELLKVL